MTCTSSDNALIVYGHVGFDISIAAGKITRVVGGAAYYASMAAAAQGADVTLVSVLGADLPDAALMATRLDTSRIARELGPSAVFTQTYNDQNDVTAFDGQLNVCLTLCPDLIPLVAVVPSAILIATAPPKQQSQALEWLLDQGFRGLIAIDTTLAYITEFNALLKRDGRGIGLLFVNASEYEALAQHPPSCTRTIVKRGSQGASLLEDCSWIHATAPRFVRGGTITGAGDVFAGAFLAAILKRKASDAALADAVAFATRYVETGAKCFRSDFSEDKA